MTLMTETEHKAAAKALMRWFESQQIQPADATAVMSIVKAVCLVDNTRDIRQLQNAANDIGILLALDIARCLRHVP